MVGPGPRVLVVDDDPAVRRFLRVALKAAGFSVFEAGSADAVSTAVAAIRPDHLAKRVVERRSYDDYSGMAYRRDYRGLVDEDSDVVRARQERG